MAQSLNIIVKSCRTSDSETYFHLKYITLLLLLQCTQRNQIPTSMGNELYCINGKTPVNVTQKKKTNPDKTPTGNSRSSALGAAALLGVPG